MRTIQRTFAFLMFAMLVKPAVADNLFGEFQRLPDQIERGFSVGGDFGLLFITQNRGSAVNPGFQLAFTTGYDIMKYLTVERVEACATEYGVHAAIVIGALAHKRLISYRNVHMFNANVLEHIPKKYQF